ncbi:Uncharacterised protein [Neisseria animaloris]|uniref:hypothetical protein n=1 Tax=Neisseria animaloris TaxID=326522 RepID=UPI000A199E99|nr:hypothetical protein [Neisseria animaloris]OSI06817.1 hypothetical protein BWD08_10675 [Neisseria animaloris]VEH86553.1 Uncharacterised protein [Neisseria animaloris]
MSKRWIVTARDIFVGGDIIRAFTKVQVEEAQAAYLVDKGFAVYDDLQGGTISTRAMKALYDITRLSGFAGSFEEFSQAMEGLGGGGQESGHVQEGYYSREDLERFNGNRPLGNSQFVTVSWPSAFKTRPFAQITADIASNSVRQLYIQNITETGFDLAVSYGGDLKGVWYRAYVK